jgi:non-ribosomal peptide synthetase-like protein
MLEALSTPFLAHLPSRQVRSAAPAPTLLHEFFERAAKRWPEHTAVEVPPSPSRPTRRTISYGEFDRRANALANRLREFVTQECVVAILLPRTSERIYLSQLAILKAGAAYCCIDPILPDSQVRRIIADACPTVVLTDATGIDRIHQIEPGKVCALDVAAAADHLSGFVPSPPAAPWLTPASLAYVIFTSGSTGQPKGVMIEHAGIVNLIRGDMETFPVGPEDRVGQNSSCAYDSSVEEIWMSFSSGSTLVVMDDETTRLGPDLIEWLRSESITIFSPPPTLLRTTGCVNPKKELPALRRVHVGGEPLPHDLAHRWSEGICLLNDYGPTECSVVSLRAVIRPGDPINIGGPLPGLGAWILDEQMEEVGEGETGELVLNGPGLARGYMNDPALTAEKFHQHPRFGRVFRTGDLAHRDGEGKVYCHGRIDSQVKIRGYRIELEAIEARLTAYPGVRAAACRVQGDGPAQQIVAFIVPGRASAPPAFEDLRTALREQLPEFMVPSHFGALPVLPTTVSGKLNRRALPTLEFHICEMKGQAAAPRNSIEATITRAFGQVLGLRRDVPVDHDFFHDLGGDSLRAAMVVSLLRDDPATSSIAVRDLYEARTAARLADRASAATAAPRTLQHGTRARRRSPLLATIVQSAWLGAGLVVSGSLAYLFAFRLSPGATESIGLFNFLIAAPILSVAGLGAYAVAAAAFAVLAKKLLIGRYRAGRHQVWGSFYVRNWMVRQAVRLVPWWAIEGTIFQHVILRRLGARIGKRVHIHRGVNFAHGGWDLLEIGDDVTLGRDVSLRLINLEEGEEVVGPITLGHGCTLDVRAGLGPDTRMEPESYLSAHSYLPAGGVVPRDELWSGVPATPAGDAPATPALSPDQALSPLRFSIVLLAARAFIGGMGTLPILGMCLLFAWVRGVDQAAAAEWALHPAMESGDILLPALLLTLLAPLGLVSRCLTMRALGKIPEGAISRWSTAYVRVWLKMEILERANDWLSGTLLWRVWLRAAGMRIGQGSEISTIIDTVPELMELGSGSFLADGIYLGGPKVHRGAVTLARTTLGNGVFLGNYALIPAGRHVPDGVLLGVGTILDGASGQRPGTSWFGVPAFELPKREVIEADPTLTHRPSRLRYANRVFWELLRFTLPLPPVFLGLAWFEMVTAAEPLFSLPVLVLGVIPLLDLAFLAALAILGLGLKWALLGRVRPGTHPLWSSWCSRWDFNYTAWHFWAGGPVAALEGTIWVNWYLRALGARIGKGVVIREALAFIVDPDMLSVSDGASVSAFFQAHTFEDRVLKLGPVAIGPRATIGNAAVLLYGSEIGEGTRVMDNSVVMKGERLLAHHFYAGSPTRLLC